MAFLGSFQTLELTLHGFVSNGHNAAGLNKKIYSLNRDVTVLLILWYCGNKSALILLRTYVISNNHWPLNAHCPPLAYTDVVVGQKWRTRAEEQNL